MITLKYNGFSSQRPSCRSHFGQFCCHHVGQIFPIYCQFCTSLPLAAYWPGSFDACATCGWTPSYEIGSILRRDLPARVHNLESYSMERSTFGSWLFSMLIWWPPEQIFDWQKSYGHKGEPAASFIQYPALGKEDSDFIHITTAYNYFGCIFISDLDSRLALVWYATHHTISVGVWLQGHQRNRLENQDHNQRSSLWMSGFRFHVTEFTYMDADLFSCSGWCFCHSWQFTIRLHYPSHHHERITGTGFTFGTHALHRCVVLFEDVHSHPMAGCWFEPFQPKQLYDSRPQGHLLILERSDSCDLWGTTETTGPPPVHQPISPTVFTGWCVSPATTAADTDWLHCHWLSTKDSSSPWGSDACNRTCNPIGTLSQRCNRFQLEVLLFSSLTWGKAFQLVWKQFLKQ